MVPGPLGPALLILAVRGRRVRSAFAAGGIFGIVAPDGQVMDRLGTWRAGHLVERVPLSSGLTLSQWLGVWPEVLLAAPVLVGLALSLRRSRRTAAAAQAPASTPEHDQPFTKLLS
ncbi:hypothetical protein [Streptomyces sporangiiformans]|uniref:Apolipoprotein N-acyltransferase n=1 Tax=Streptomyces sporangiiformans TaxID=2315329 RepID=A0A505DLW6_9ACTN|nr:hypothetical protein [Streptomyces sporangiiformans]TPQ19921.1 hypothetical protein FGD71_023025 [Streptomyces sporangiiformans]